MKASDPLLSVRNGIQKGISLSGRERNNFFLNREGKQFTDLSGVSGIDDIADGRVFVLWDLDRDGWQDIALVNSNAPLLRLYHNRIRAERQIIALRFVGGNVAAARNSKLSARDGYGVKVTLRAGGRLILREQFPGQGFAGQNSSTMLIGIGTARTAVSVHVAWPSGKQTRVGDVSAGKLVTVYEVPEQSPTREALVISGYHRPDGGRGLAAPLERSGERLPVRVDRDGAKLRMFTTMATWCATCKRELPHLGRLRSTFEADELAMYGVPGDSEESRDALEAYSKRHTPAYRLLLDPAIDRSGVLEVIGRALRQPPSLPASVITDSEGNILHVSQGVPSVSVISRLLREAPK